MTMPYSRFVDVHFMDGFHSVTFKNDVANQEDHQVGKKVAYKKCNVMPLSINRSVILQDLEEAILWVCAADGGGGKLRINAHGDAYALSNNYGDEVSMEVLAKYLRNHGLTAANMGKPGLRTINLAVCHAASGPMDTWMIKKLAHALAIPSIKFTGAAAVTRMSGAGTLQVKYEPWVPPSIAKKKAATQGGRYVPPHLRPKPEAVAGFSKSVFKKEYSFPG